MKTRNLILTTALLGFLLAGCESDGQQGALTLSFAEPLSAEPSTRAAAFDTNAFLLTVTWPSGDTLYCGTYGGKPDTFTVRNGTYEIEAVSRPFSMPSFDAPQYGDRQIAVVANGQNVQVGLFCKLMNAGIRFTFADSFRTQYGYGHLLLRSPTGDLPYRLQETRTAWFPPGNVNVVYLEGAEETPLFNRVLNAGEIHDLTLNASSDKASAGLSISVDTTAMILSENIVIGPGYPGCDGKTQETAWDVATASAHPGDTAWVWGYIVGGDLSSGSIRFEPPFEKSSNLAIAASASERDRADCFSVELSKAAVRAELNLVDHPENLGKKVFLYGVVSTYFSLPGLKSVTACFL